MGRRQAREGALQMLYAWDVNTNSFSAAETIVRESLELSDKDYAFMMSIVNSVIENIHRYDNIITNCLKDWSLNRLNIVDRSILRIAVAELDGLSETPKQVIVNEAVELAKEYSDDLAYKFINGILGNVNLDQ